MAESTQHKLSKLRPPRVQITYDVEIGDDVQMKELPLVVGVMSDLSGESEKDKGTLRKRKFVEIDGDNFSEVMESIEPKIEINVPNKLTEKGGTMNLGIKFKNMDDFDPYHVVQQVEPLKKLYDARTHLADLMGKLDGNDKLEDLLSDVVGNTPGLEEIKTAAAAGEKATAEAAAPAADAAPEAAKDGKAAEPEKKEKKGKKDK